MPDVDDYVHDAEGNLIRIRYASPPEHLQRAGPIRTYLAAERALIRQRQDQEEAERKSQEARMRAEANKQANYEIAALSKKNYPVNPQTRALQLND